MSIPGAASPLFLSTAAGGAAGGYAINRSLRFNSGDSAYLNRQPSSAGNRRTWTWSGWVKRTKLGAEQQLFRVDKDSNGHNTTDVNFTSANKLQVYTVTGNSLVGNKITSQVFRDVGAWMHLTISFNSPAITIYVNGVEVTAFDTNTVPGSAYDSWINSANTHLIGRNLTSGSVYGDFYLADVQFIDSQALSASDFGETDSNGVWQPIEYAGTYSSGSNYVGQTTYNNVDAGSVDNLFDGSTSTTFEANSAGGNIVFTPTGGIAYTTSVEVYTARSTAQGVSLNGGTQVSTSSGWNTIDSGSGTLNTLTFYNGSAGNQSFAAIRVDGTILIQGSGFNSFHLDFSDGADLGNDSSGANNDWTPNNLVGQLATGDQGMDVVTYTGTASTKSISNLKFSPGLVWIKQRSGGAAHHLFDSIRGPGERLISNGTQAEYYGSDSLTSFDSNGFTLGADTSSGCVNNPSGSTYVAWAWKAGGAAVSNTDGTITSSVSANQTHGFSIVSYTGNGNNTNSATSPAVAIGHGLNAAPSMIIAKDRTSSRNWPVYHVGIGTNSMCELDTTGAAQTTYSWNQTAPSSSVFYVGNNGQTNNNGNNYIAYCWSEVAGYSKFGSFSGGTNPKTVTTGFKPRFLAIKRTDISNNWAVFDSARGESKDLKWNTSEFEVTDSYLEFVSDGFKITSTHAMVNASGGSYIYMAFAAGGDGADLDSLLDTPEQRSGQTDSGSGGDVVGNYATLNPLDETNATLSNGNLDVEVNSAGTNYANGTIAISSGKWYFETTAVSGINNAIGVADINGTPGFETSGSYVYYQNTGALWHTGANSYGASWQTAGDVIGIAIDMDTPQLIFYKNGVSQGVAVTSWLSGKTVVPCFTCGGGSGNKVVANFGARAFTHAAPNGYSALCTANLSDPTIADGSKYFDTVTYAGTSATKSFTNFNFSPGFAWIKTRNTANDHNLVDIVRGAPNILMSNKTDAEITNSTDGFVSFDSAGFTLGANTQGTQSDELNKTGFTYVGWAWDGGSSTVTNTDGSISSQVRANPSAGFSIVSYTGAGSATTIGHGLNAAPTFIVIKQRTGTNSWAVYHTSIGAGSYLTLETTGAALSNVSPWNNTTPSSSVFSLATASGSDAVNRVNLSSQNYVAYCFAPVEGYSSAFSYTGNGSADGPMVFLGFRPSWILLKRSDGEGSWRIWDTSRDLYNVSDFKLYPDSSGAETGSSDTNEIDILSNGFKLRSSVSEGNASGGTYVGYAFAENPFKSSRAR